MSTPNMPVQVTYMNRPAIVRTPYAIQYGKHDRGAVKWISGIQLALGIICLIIQSVTLGFIDTWMVARGKFRSANDYNVYVWLDTPDEGATGVWSGIFVIITAAIGVASWKQNRKPLIVTYLVLSVFLIPVSLALIGTSSAAVSYLKDCRFWGTYTDSYYYSYYSTTPPLHLYLFGEDLGPRTKLNRFHCLNPMFQVWLGFDAVLIVAAMMLFVLSLMSVVYSSKAACGGCCSCCDCCTDSSDESVPYSRMCNPAQPMYATQHATFCHPHVVGQPQAMYANQAPGYPTQEAPQPPIYTNQPPAAVGGPQPTTATSGPALANAHPQKQPPPSYSPPSGN